MARSLQLGMVIALLSSTASTAFGDDVERKLTAYEAEARQLGTDLPQPNQRTQAQGQRRLVDAQVAYSLGDYDQAALMLFELSSKSGPDQETATFYLAESLYQKGDRGAARSYYDQLVQKGSTGRYYQPSLLRIVEIGIAQNDPGSLDQTIAQVNSLPGGAASPQVPYVRGKYAFSVGKYDEAISDFTAVPKGSDKEYQAAYYTATSYVAKKEFDKAIEIFNDLTTRKPKTANDRRVEELAALALGRLYYERDQPGKSIDTYLLVDRKSDLFPDALYEVAWVYVKGKQFDKALTALELLHLSDPTSQKTPTVKILEGNLRIRKAQSIRQIQINGVIDAKSQLDPQVEYDKAAAVFTETHDAYMPSYEALKQMVDGNLDPASFLAQIAGRSSSVFQATAPIPEAAAQYLRDEPAVQRVVAEETDLAEIESDLAESESTIQRLEAVLAANDKTAVYPLLQGRRTRIGVIQDDLIRIRSALHDQLGGEGAETASRKQLMQSYTAMPNAEQSYADHIAQVRAQYDVIEQGTGEVTSAIDSTQAMAVAMRKFANDSTTMPADQKKTVTTTLDDAFKEAQSIENELSAINREIQLGRDLAGVGADEVIKARDIRSQLKQALDNEQRALVGRSNNQKVAALANRAALISDNLAQTEKAIDEAVTRGMAEVKTLIATERANIAAYKKELDDYNRESRAIGTGVLGASFKDVKAKFYDIVIRTDVGNVDVLWSQKEDDDDDLKRLNLSRQREMKQLKDEFRDILEGGEAKKPVKKTESFGPAPGTAPNGSPDKGTSGGRVSPGADKKAAPPPPAPVQPDAKKPDTKQPAPKKGGAK